MSKINLEAFNWYRLDHQKVYEKFKGDLTYVGTFCVLNEYNPVAVYHNANPDRNLNHKDYVLLTVNLGTHSFVRGMDASDMEKWRKQDAVRCIICKDIIYSVTRHDFRLCKCGVMSIDGGRNYTKVSYENRYEGGTVDLIDGTFTIKNETIYEN